MKRISKTMTPTVLAVVLLTCSLVYSNDKCEDLRKQISAAGGLVGEIGVPGHFLSRRSGTSLVVDLGKSWKGSHLQILDDPSVRGIRFHADSLLPGDSLLEICDFSNLRSLSVDFGRSRDRWNITRIHEITSLWSLSISGAGFGDHDLKQVQRMPELVVLSLKDTSVTNDSAKLIKEKFPSLKTLVLDGAPVRSPLSEFVPHHIEVLSARDVQLSSDDVNFLMTLRTLRTADIRGSELSQSDLELLQSRTEVLIVDDGENAGLRGN